MARESEKTGSRSINAESDISVRRERPGAAVREARERFGGLDIPATLVGTLTALAVLLLLGGLVSAALGAIGYQIGAKGQEELSIGAVVASVVVLFVSFLIGGWAAGRIARYDGARNGVMTVVWMIVLAAILAALGAWLGSEYNVFARFDLPQPFSRDALTIAAIVSGLIALVVALAGGFLGGKWGERYHRRADETILATRAGGIVRGA